METLGVVKDPWNGGIYAISAIKRGMVVLVPIGGGKPMMVKQAILDFFYKRETGQTGYREGGDDWTLGAWPRAAISAPLPFFLFLSFKDMGWYSWAWT